jgi:hypothetical protein
VVGPDGGQIPAILVSSTCSGLLFLSPNPLVGWFVGGSGADRLGRCHGRVGAHRARVVVVEVAVPVDGSRLVYGLVSSGLGCFASLG